MKAEEISSTKLDRKKLNELAQDKSSRIEFIQSSQIKPREGKKSPNKESILSVERLAGKHSWNKFHQNLHEEESEIVNKKITPPKLQNANAKEVTERILHAEQLRKQEIHHLQSQYEEQRKKEFAQFKPWKGSEKIVKSLFKNEKEYAKPAHERLYEKIKHRVSKLFLKR